MAEVTNANNMNALVESMYAPPGQMGALELSFMYEGVPPYAVESSKVQARVNAAFIASSVDRSRKDASEVYNAEFNVLSGLSNADQETYTRSRVNEEALASLGATLNQFAVATRAGLLVKGEPQYNQRMVSVLEQMHAIDRAHEEGAGKGASTDLVAAINNSDSAFVRMSAERVEQAKLLSKTLERLGYDVDKLNPFRSGSIKDGLGVGFQWLKELAPGRMIWETTEYDTGPSDIKRIQGLSPIERMNELELKAEKLVKNGASPITVLGVFGAYASDASPTVTGAFQALDLLDLIVLSPAAIRKTWRTWRSARILRQMSTPMGAAEAIGAKDVAARLAASVLTSSGSGMGDVAKGLDKATAAMSASPWKWTPLEPAAVEGLSHRIQEYIEKHRKVQSYYISKAINKFTVETSGFMRPGEIEAARANIMSKLPETAEIVESTPFGLKVRITVPNKEKFVTPEDLDLAKRKLDFWTDEYQKVVDEEDLFYSQARQGGFDPDPEWVNRLERNKQKARAEMEKYDQLVTKGIQPDQVDERFIWYTRNEFSGEINGVLESSPGWELFASPSGYLRTIDDLTVPERAAVLAKQEKLAVLFQKTLREVMYGLGRKNMERVGAVLSFGSDRQKIFSASELMNGIEVPGIGTVKLNKREVAAYYKYRDTMDAAWGMRSLMKFKELGWKGYTKQTVLTLGSVDETGNLITNNRKVFVKPYGYRKNADGTATIAMPPASKIVDATNTKGVASVTSISPEKVRATLKDRIERGTVALVQFEEPVRIGDDILNYGIISTKRLQELTPDVLGFRPAYVPNIYKAPYAVRAKVKKVFDGRDRKEIFETRRFFGTRREGEEWIKAQQDGVEYILHSDKEWRTVDPQYSADVSDATFTGLYTTHRGEKIPFGPMGEETPTESAFVAMDRYMDNLSWSYPLNDWRESILARYFNTVNDYLVTPNSITSEFKTGVELSESQKSAIIALRNYVTDQLSIVSGDEMVFSRWSKYIGERLEDSLIMRGLEKLPGGKELTERARLAMLYGETNADVYGKMRSLVFHAYLGAGNIAQWFVQASNAMTVFALHPTNAPSVMRRILALRLAAFMNPADPQYVKIINRLSKAAMMKYDEFEPMVRAWHNSGWAYTTRSSADTRTAIRALSPGGTMKQSARTVQKLLLLPFTEGELVSRLYGWLDSYTRMDRAARKAGKVIDWTRPDKVNELVAEAQRVAFNYTSVNKARWQKGITSIPTQFMQVPAKFYEELLMPIASGGKFKSQFTKGERLRLILAQPIMFGMMGIPFAPFFKDAIFKMLSEEGEGGTIYPNVDKDTLALYVGGLTDWMSAQLIELASDKEAHPALASRISMANGFDILISNFTQEDPDIAKALLGAFGGVTTQQALPVISRIVKMQNTKLGADTLEPEDAWAIVNELGTIAKSWDNYQRARLWEAAEAILSRKGKTLIPIDPEGEDKMLVFLKKIGIGTHEEYAAMKIWQWNKQNNPEKEIGNALQTSQDLLLSYIRSGEYASPKVVEKFSKELAIIRETLSSEEDKVKFDQEWVKLLLDSKSLAGKEAQKFLEMQLEYSNGNVLAAPPVEGAWIEDRILEEGKGGQ